MTLKILISGMQNLSDMSKRVLALNMSSVVADYVLIPVWS